MASFGDKVLSLHKSATSSPEYAEIIPFFIDLFGFLEKRGSDSGITLQIPAAGTRERLANGFPLVSPDHLRIEREQCVAFMAELIELLKKIGREGEAELTGIGAALASGTLDPASIFKGILERKRSVIDEAASSINVPATLLEYLFEIPLKAALELFAATITPETFVDWQESHCPLCGSRAGIAELGGEEGRRYLCCSCCSSLWQFKRMKCPYCGSEESDKLSYFTVDERGTRVDTCKSCSRYIKTRDSRKAGAEAPLEVEDILTIHLDLVAAREGFERGK